MKKYHWVSLETGELQETLMDVIASVVSDVAYFFGKWSLSDLVKYSVRWRYSRSGF